MTLLESSTPVLSHRHPSSAWTAERIELLAKRWGEGLSATQIAVELGHVSRSAVLGKKNRLKLPEREPCRAGAPIQHGRRSKFRPDGFHRSPIGCPTAPSLPVDPHAPSPHACALLDLDDTKCHWPIGEPGKTGFHFCGAPSASPYCAGHYGIAYRRAG